MISDFLSGIALGDGLRNSRIRVKLEGILNCCNICEFKNFFEVIKKKTQNNQTIILIRKFGRRSSASAKN